MDFDFGPRVRDEGLSGAKTHLCRYIEEMSRGDFDTLVIRRYQRPLALLLPICRPGYERKREAAERAALADRVADERRMARARILSAPSCRVCAKTHGQPDQLNQHFSKSAGAQA